MNNPIKTVATKILESVNYLRGGEAPQSTKNFKKRKDNTNYYKGSGYWGKNKN